MDLPQASQQTTATANAIKAAIGVQPDVGYRIHNGRLVEVSARFAASDVTRFTVEQLQRAVRPAVREGFAAEPEQISIVITTSGRAE